MRTGVRAPSGISRLILWGYVAVSTFAGYTPINIYRQCEHFSHLIARNIHLLQQKCTVSRLDLNFAFPISSLALHRFDYPVTTVVAYLSSIYHRLALPSREETHQSKIMS